MVRRRGEMAPGLPLSQQDPHPGLRFGKAAQLFLILPYLQPRPKGWGGLGGGDGAPGEPGETDPCGGRTVKCGESLPGPQVCPLCFRLRFVPRTEGSIGAGQAGETHV